MSKHWMIVFAVAAALLVVVGVMWTWLGALLGGLILLAWASTALLLRVVVVHQRTALVVSSRIGDAVERVVTHPGWTTLRPWEKAGLVLDTSHQAQVVQVEDVLQADLTPTTLGFQVTVIRQLEPDRIPTDRLGQILPELNEYGLHKLVEAHTDYCLRRLIAAESGARSGGLGHERLERQLQATLQHRLRSFGVTVVALRVVVRPPTGLYQTLTNAEQQRVGIDLRTEQMSALLSALTDRREQARSLALLELARALGLDGQKWVALDLAAWLGPNSAQGPEESGTQVPPWARRREPVQ